MAHEGAEGLWVRVRTWHMRVLTALPDPNPDPTPTPDDTGGIWRPVPAVKVVLPSLKRVPSTRVEPRHMVQPLYQVSGSAPITCRRGRGDQGSPSYAGVGVGVGSPSYAGVGVGVGSPSHVVGGARMMREWN